VVKTLIERTGSIVDTGDGQLLIQFERPQACGSCVSHSICSMQSTGQNPEMLVRLPAANFSDLPPDSKVTVQLPQGGFGRLLALCYLMQPVCMLLGAWFIGTVVGDSDLAAAAGALAGLAVGCSLLWLYDARGGGQSWLRKLIIRPLGDASPDRALSG